MSFELAVVSCFRKFATFRGRAGPAEYWWWQLFLLLLLIFIGVMSTLSPSAAGWLALLWIFGLAVPSLAVSVRRLHDVGWSGWWMLAGLVGVGWIFLILLFAWPGQATANRFGPRPRRIATPRLTRIPRVRRK
ncbi:DUF805 domain-containing protein [Jannaschia seohaensis]|uniref:Uncharacterized membrane protein YhaH (DUF805 family) n=1 Tax=Jannaschia seohaensis TaxID=475081 RepID=A0A2Y9AQM4_9RHOB|nr:DUF805 domain-containing protein [Jannaschia seohaensis]PWJ18169.1 uncharacterized membrane protein YhaH (DUF805 family) [Jannaschia seohaensis]SSA46694.1 Uncharacterized membrane protein YhaH, DUF805 family [Jannaschia seohaensis]